MEVFLTHLYDILVHKLEAPPAISHVFVLSVLGQFFPPIDTGLHSANTATRQRRPWNFAFEMKVQQQCAILRELWLSV
jgi:hypothetical protein